MVGGPYSRTGPLVPYRVLDLTSGDFAYGARMLADLGADVVKIEPPEGDYARWLPPFAGDGATGETSLAFLHQNLGKRSAVLDLEDAEGRETFRHLAGQADVLIEAFPPGHLDRLGIGWDTLHALNPTLVMASITPFGESGPRAGWRGAPIVGFAMSGSMQVSGWPDVAPCNAPHAMADHAAATYAVDGVMVALWSRGETGEGQRVQVSVQEAAIGGLYPWEFPTFSYAERGMPTGMPSVAERGAYVSTFYEASDGHVRVIASTPRQWEGLLRTLGNPEELMFEEWADPAFRKEHGAELHEIVSSYTRERTMDDLMAHGQASGLPIGAVRRPHEFVSDPNSRARDYWLPIDHPVAGVAEYPSAPYRLSTAPLSFGRPAPLLGEHTAEVLAELDISRGVLAGNEARS